MNKKLKPLLSSEKMDWGTPKEFFDGLEKLFGKFDLDAAASRENTKCFNYYSESDNALKAPWTKYVPMVYAHDGQIRLSEPNSPVIQNVYLNPPYGRTLVKWIDKAIEEAKKGATVVVLVPARTDTKWFRKCWHNASEIYFVQGRLKFEGAPTSAPFPSMVVVFSQERLDMANENGTPGIRLMGTKGEVIG